MTVSKRSPWLPHPLSVYLSLSSYQNPSQLLANIFLNYCIFEDFWKGCNWLFHLRYLRSEISVLKRLWGTKSALLESSRSCYPHIHTTWNLHKGFLMSTPMWEEVLPLTSAPAKEDLTVMCHCNWSHQLIKVINLDPGNPDPCWGLHIPFWPMKMKLALSNHVHSVPVSIYS